MMAERGQQQIGDIGSEFNAFAFLVQQRIGRMNTCTMVQVRAVTNAGGVEPVGYVDILPLVNQVDGNNNATPHGVIHGVPYFRLQGGADAVIIDPKVNDIGFACFADHDISSVLAKGGQANPGSGRRFAMRDAIYVGGLINDAPQQYLRFSSAGVELISEGTMMLTAPGGVNINGVTIDASGAVVAPQPISAPNVIVAGKSVNGHTHSGQVPGF